MRSYLNWYLWNSIKYINDFFKLHQVYCIECFYSDAMDLFLEPLVLSDLQYVRIYFDTPTFDRITKDTSAKFVDKLSAIGGTMGLLTGFSIISGVEILYFLFKFIFTMFYNNKK